MTLKPIQVSILIVQTAALLLNLYAIFIKKVSDSSGHWIAVALVLTIMALSIKSWYDSNSEESNKKSIS
ncbi:MAG: hypothetical protein Q8930_14795 [Bacillota bacterium]|nr:hypothetical protein [Bacillota bacterium]